MDIWKMDIDELKRVYAEETQRLSEDLLNGAEWESMASQRELLIRIGVALDQRAQGHDSPVSSR